MLFNGFSLMACPGHFLVEPGTTISGMAPPTTVDLMEAFLCKRERERERERDRDRETETERQKDRGIQRGERDRQTDRQTQRQRTEKGEREVEFWETKLFSTLPCLTKDAIMNNNYNPGFLA